MSDRKNADLLSAAQAWPTHRFARFLADAASVVIEAEMWEGGVDDPSPAEIAAKKLSLLNFGTATSVQETIAKALSVVCEEAPLLVAAALHRLLADPERLFSPEEFRALIQLLIDSDYDKGERFIYESLDWIALHGGRRDYSTVLPFLVYLMADAGGGNELIPLLLKLDDRKMLTRKAVEAALRIVASDQPSLLPHVLKFYGKALESAVNLKSGAIRDFLEDLVERSTPATLASALVQLGPVENIKLFRAAFSIDQPTTVFTVTRRDIRGCLKLVAAHGTADIVDLSSYIWLFAGEGRDSKWIDALSRTIGRTIPRASPQSELEPPVVEPTRLATTALVTQMAVPKAVPSRDD